MRARNRTHRADARGDPAHADVPVEERSEVHAAPPRARRRGACAVNRSRGAVRPGRRPGPVGGFSVGALGGWPRAPGTN